jgi:hypothetical protein
MYHVSKPLDRRDLVEKALFWELVARPAFQRLKSDRRAAFRSPSFIEERTIRW